MNLLINPKSPLFRVIFLATVALCIWNWLQYIPQNSTSIFISHTILTLFSALLILFALIPWYGLKYKGLGIDDHYEKILVLTTYVLILQNIFVMIGWTSLIFNIFLSIVFFVLLLINIILLTYHFRDKDKTPPAYFAANLYLKEEEKP